MSFFKKKESNSLVALFDVGSGSVGGALVLMHPNRKPIILYTTRKQFILQEDLDFERFVRGMEKALDSVAEDLSKNGIKSARLKTSNTKIKQAYVTLASPWYVAQTKSVSIKKDKPFTFSKQFTDQVIFNEKEEFEKSRQIVSSPKTKKGPEILEALLVDVKLNGYSTHAPFGKEAKVADMTVFLSMASKETTDKISKTIDKYFHARDIHFHSFALTSFSALRDLFENKEDFMFVEMNAEITDVFVVGDGKLLENLSFPIGVNHILRLIAWRDETSLEDALSLFNLYAEGKAHGSVEKLVEEVVNEVGGEWKELFQETLSSLPGKLAPVHDFITLAPNQFDNVLEKYVESNLPQTISVNNFDITSIQGASMKDYVNNETGSSPDKFLSLESLYISKFF